MRKFMMVAAFSLFLSSPLFAMDESMAPDEARSPDCEAIADSCRNAGFSGKGFWHDCMKPVLFGKSVKDVNVDEKVVKACRQFKIKNLQEQLDQMKEIKDK